MTLRTVMAFHQDEDGEWIAELACGHSRHVRHNPPWSLCHWVLTAEGRADFVGRELECRACGSVERTWQDAEKGN